MDLDGLDYLAELQGPGGPLGTRVQSHACHLPRPESGKLFVLNSR